MSHFEIIKGKGRTSSSSSTGGEHLPAQSTPPTTGSTYSADRGQHSAGRAYPKMPSGSSSLPNRTNSTANTSKQSTRATGHVQHAEAVSKFYDTSSQGALSTHVLRSVPSLTRLTESEDPNRPSAGYTQIGERTSLPILGSGVRPDALTGTFLPPVHQDAVGSPKYQLRKM